MNCRPLSIPKDYVKNLNIAEQILVNAKALLTQNHAAYRIMVFDEPTANVRKRKDSLFAQILIHRLGQRESVFSCPPDAGSSLIWRQITIQGMVLRLIHQESDLLAKRRTCQHDGGQGVCGTSLPKRMRTQGLPLKQKI